MVWLATTRIVFMPRLLRGSWSAARRRRRRAAWARCGASSTPCTGSGDPVLVRPADHGGTLSKLKSGGGDVTCHSSVSERHGLPTARGPPRHEAIML
jgi:hypothetical protein